MNRQDKIIAILNINDKLVPRNKGDQFGDIILWDHTDYENGIAKGWIVVSSDINGDLQAMWLDNTMVTVNDVTDTELDMMNAWLGDTVVA